MQRKVSSLLLLNVESCDVFPPQSTLTSTPRIGYSLANVTCNLGGFKRAGSGWRKLLPTLASLRMTWRQSRKRHSYSRNWQSTDHNYFAHHFAIDCNSHGCRSVVHTVLKLKASWLHSARQQDYDISAHVKVQMIACMDKFKPEVSFMLWSLKMIWLGTYAVVQLAALLWQFMGFTGLVSWRSLQNLVYHKMLLLADGEAGFNHHHISLHAILLFIVGKEHFAMLNVLQE